MMRAATVAVLLAGLVACGGDDKATVATGRVDVADDGAVTVVTFTADETAAVADGADAAGKIDKGLADKIGNTFVMGGTAGICRLGEAIVADLERTQPGVGTSSQAWNVSTVYIGDLVRFGVLADVKAECPDVVAGIVSETGRIAGG